MTIDDDDMEVAIFVIPDELMPYDILLGRDVLRKSGKRLTIESGVLKVEAATTTRFVIGKNISNEERKVLNHLLMEHKECFAESLEELGRCKSTSMEISVSTDTPIVVLFVKKSNGERRMCTDFRALNAATVEKQYSIPVVEEQLSLLAGNRYFTTLDMTSGYYQIPIKEECKK
ncbi:uncharacterized protein LOC142235364 [Haematobia irritans]|uniref:uncharacterized protein LOC142235364 n=1 Tax=Haematobia irritans TaxID=7368 RepID=UPI003F5067DA